MQVNKERQSVAAASLAPDRCLMEMATARANDMLDRNYFSHITPDGTAPWQTMRAQGCTFHFMGENIAEAPDPMFAVTELWTQNRHRRSRASRRHGDLRRRLQRLTLTFVARPSRPTNERREP
ncbi:MAG: CAP domain-containing protein [Candidatus Aquilonibacter sp.]